MYISHIKVKGFRNFKDSDIEFNDGLNVLIGHNNAGKTNCVNFQTEYILTDTPSCSNVRGFVV